MILGIHLGHHFLYIVILDFIHSIPEDAAGSRVALGDNSYLVRLSCNIDAWGAVGTHRRNIVHVIVEVVRIEIILFYVCCIFGPRKQILPALFVIQDFDQEFGIEL